jgi:hypothetical protein
MRVVSQPFLESLKVAICQFIDDGRFVAAQELIGIGRDAVQAQGCPWDDVYEESCACIDNDLSELAKSYPQYLVIIKGLRADLRDEMRKIVRESD